MLYLAAAILGTHFQSPIETKIQRFWSNFTRQQKAVGVAVGVLDHGKPYEMFFGEKEKGQGLPDGKTLFQIGSVTKVFTSLLLAKAVEEDKVALTDPLQKYLPRGVRSPGPIALEGLATHYSGLPRVLSNPDGSNVSVEEMYTRLPRVRLVHRPGTAFLYSNLGFGLLGESLARAYGSTSWEAIIKQEVLDPLDMSSTGITLDQDARKLRAVPYDKQDRPISYNNPAWPAVNAAGALYSNLDDMMKFAKFLSSDDGPEEMRRARDLCLLPYHKMPKAGHFIGLGWQLQPLPEGRVYIDKDGAVTGSRCYIAFMKGEDLGIVVMVNKKISPVGAGKRFFQSFAKVNEGTTKNDAGDTDVEES